MDHYCEAFIAQPGQCLADGDSVRTGTTRDADPLPGAGRVAGTVQEPAGGGTWWIRAMGTSTTAVGLKGVPKSPSWVPEPDAR